MKRILVMMVLVLLAATAWALPSVEAVQAEVARGNYAQAENMMHDVIAARPGSARAHYVYAEILAHDGHFDQAAQELRVARRIAPDLAFTQPERFRAFEQELEREQRAATGSPAVQSRAMGAPGLQQRVGHGGGIPGWGWAIAAAALAALFWRGFSARPRAASMPPAFPVAGPAGPATTAGNGAPLPATGYGPSAGASGAGSGMLGTGLAAAGGVAAGMLVEKLLDERGAPGGSGASALGAGSGFAPGFTSGGPEANPAAADLEQRPIDFGSGDDWGSGGIDDGGSGGGMDDSGGGGNGGW
jgi:hypothetical protein